MVIAIITTAGSILITMSSTIIAIMIFMLLINTSVFFNCEYKRGLYNEVNENRPLGESVMCPMMSYGFQVGHGYLTSFLFKSNK